MCTSKQKGSADLHFHSVRSTLEIGVGRPLRGLLTCSREGRQESKSLSPKVENERVRSRNIKVGLGILRRNREVISGCDGRGRSGNVVHLNWALKLCGKRDRQGCWEGQCRRRKLKAKTWSWDPGLVSLCPAGSEMNSQLLPCRPPGLAPQAYGHLQVCLKAQPGFEVE